MHIRAVVGERHLEEECAIRAGKFVAHEREREVRCGGVTIVTRVVIRVIEAKPGATAEGGEVLSARTRRRPAAGKGAGGREG